MVSCAGVPFTRPQSSAGDGDDGDGDDDDDDDDDDGDGDGDCDPVTHPVRLARIPSEYRAASDIAVT